MWQKDEKKEFSRAALPVALMPSFVKSWELELVDLGDVHQKMAKFKETAVIFGHLCIVVFPFFIIWGKLWKNGATSVVDHFPTIFGLFLAVVTHFVGV